MSKEIKEFLEKLENWKDNFEIKEYDTKNNNSDLSQITTMLKEKDIDGLLAFWKEKLTQDYFELAHPEYPEIVSRAVKNYNDGIINIIVMIDEKNKYPWLICQRWNIIDIVITQNNIYEIIGIKSDFFNNVTDITKLNIEDMLYSDCIYGIIVSKTRPYHFFYDQLKYQIELKISNKNIYLKDPFFIPSFIKNKDLISNKDIVYIYPSCIQNNELNQKDNKKIKQLNEQMEKYVYEDALKDFNSTTHSSDTLKLWYGITGQKRSWLEQIDGCENIVLNLLKHYSKIELIIDGMTATEGEILENKDDQEVYDKIVSKLKDKCIITSLIGKDYREKIQVCSTTDLFIANAGTGCMVPLRFCKKAGVLHSNSKLITFPDTYPDTVKFYDKKHEIDAPDSKIDRRDFYSYHIPWQHIFNLTVEVLNQTNGTDIKSLDIPDVKQLAEEYERQQQEINKDKVAFENLEKVIKPNSKSADILRDVALAFEKSGDITTAKAIMEKAHMLKPSGPFIKQKLDEYKEIIGNKK